MKPGRMPGGMGGMNMNALMKQAQKMQADMQKKQAELEVREYTATAGGGAVSATVMNKQIKNLTINPEVGDPEDAEMLADLVMAPINEALRVADETFNAEMAKVTGGMGMGF